MDSKKKSDYFKEQIIDIISENLIETAKFLWENISQSRNKKGLFNIERFLFGDMRIVGHRWYLANY